MALKSMTSGVRENEPTVTVVVLSFNGAGVLRPCIESVLAADYGNFDLILVDNGSTDGSIEEVSEMLSIRRGCRIVRNARNLGFTAGFNVGLALATGDFVLLLNNDTVIDRSALRSYVDFFRRNPIVDLAEGRIVNVLPHIRGKTSNPNMTNLFGLIAEETPPVDDASSFQSIDRMFAPVGVWPMIRRTAYVRLGGYDEDFVWMEEIRDLAARVWLSGSEVGYVYDAVVQHVGRANLLREVYGNKIAEETVFNITKNATMMILKNCQSRTLAKYAIPYVGLRVLDLMNAMRSGRRRFLTKLRAHAWVIGHLDSILAKRRWINGRVRTVSDRVAFRLLKRAPLRRVLRSKGQERLTNAL